MTVIRLSERSPDRGGAFQVRVSFGDDAEYDVEITDPADDDAEAKLAWYFEEHLRYPFLDKDLENAVAMQIATYGKALFNQVFGGEANHDYRKLRERSFDECRLEVSGSAALHRLHWEALHDPYLGMPLAVRLPVTRRVEALPSRFDLAEHRPTLNILVMTSRPYGSNDVGYRTISRPLLDALRTAGMPVNLDLVRPGTWEALRDRLQSATDLHGSGWYHVVHFDMHGMFSDYMQLEEGRSVGRYLLSPGPLAPFEGRRGFLFFETKRDSVAEPVPSETVAALLAEHRVPVAVLNACQSAMQSASEASLAQRLAEAGLPVAVGMAYSVTVSAAVRAMPLLYGKLAEGADLTTAVHTARRDLYEHQGRQAYFDQQLNLEDWMLPVMFGQRPLRIRLRSMTDEEQAQFYGRAALTGDEPPTEYGFVGRDLDIQAIERRILGNRDSNELLVQGMAGAGKSTLLTHVAWWWQRTGLVESAFRFSYQDRAWTCDQIVREIRSKLLSPAEHARADAMPDAAQLEQIVQHMRARRHLLILDNAESITATPAAIPHALIPAEQERLKTLLSRLRGGRTLVLLGSREPESWLTSSNTGPGIYPLAGLDPQAASVLVERILRRHSATRHLENEAQRKALQDLVTLLAGYPLALTVVLPALASVSPATVVAEFKAGGTDADPSGFVLRAIEYSHGKLDPVLQNSLLLLAPFTSVIGTGSTLAAYRDLVLKDAIARSLGPIDLAAALDQAVSVGLAAPHPELRNTVQLHPALPYFLRSRLYAQSALRETAEHAHYLLYIRQSFALIRMLDSHDSPLKRVSGQEITRAEYSNLTAALEYGLRTTKRVSPLVEILDEYLDQTEQLTARRELLENVITAYTNPVNEAQQADLASFHSLAGTIALTQHRLEDAESHYERAAQLFDSLADPKNKAGALTQLGLLAEQQRRPSAAEARLREALRIFLECGDRHSAGNAHQHLGNITSTQGHLETAEDHYRKALSIFTEMREAHSMANCYYSLADLALSQGRFDDAESSQREVLHIFLTFGDKRGVADSYYALANISLAQDRIQDAETNYRQALEIYLEVGDRPNSGAAGPFRGLGMITQKQGRLEEAEANYRQALDRFLGIGDRGGTAATHRDLGNVAMAQRRYADAEAHYGQALGTYLELGDQDKTARTSLQLAILAEERQLLAVAEAHYRQALDIFRDCDPEAAAITATRLSVILSRLGRHKEAIEVLLNAASLRRRETDQWDLHALRMLRQQWAFIEPGDATALIMANVPPDLMGEFCDVFFHRPEDSEEPDTLNGR
jgi:tetratricopeptide (TPR) repeat protein